MDRQSPNDDSEIGVALGTPPPPSKVQLTEYTDTMEDTIPLDEYQKQLLKRARHENLIIALPTSDDKSNIAVALIRQMFHQTEGQYPQVARRTVFLSPTRILIEQHYETLKRWIKAPVVLLHGDTDEVDRGEESMQLWANHQVLLLTPRTFIKCITLGIIQFENLNLLIFDEAHEALPGTKSEYRQILEAFHAQCVHQPACHQPRIIALSTVTFLRQIKHKNIDAAIAQMTTIYQTKLETQVISGNHLDADHILISRVDDDRVFGPRRDAKLPSEVFNQMLDYLSTDDAQNVVTKKVLKKVESLCTQKMGPWFAVEALEIYKNTLLCNIELYQLRPDLLPILELFQLALCLQFRETEWTDLDFALKSATSEKLTALLKCIRTFGRCLNCIVFVREVIIANVIYRWIRLLSRKVPELGFIKVGFARGNMKHLFVKLTDNTYSFIRYDESTSRFKERFEEGELNLLVATSALEEGATLPRCNAVIQYDFPETYRSYVQSKGCTRDADSFYILLIDSSWQRNCRWKQSLEEYWKVEEYFRGKGAVSDHIKKPPEPEQPQIMSKHVEANSAVFRTKTGVELREHEAYQLVDQYTGVYMQRLPADVRANLKSCDFFEVVEILEKPTLFNCFFSLPASINSSEDEVVIQGGYRTNKKKAKHSCCFEVCKWLYAKGELDEQLKLRKGARKRSQEEREKEDMEMAINKESAKEDEVVLVDLSTNGSEEDSLSNLIVVHRPASLFTAIITEHNYPPEVFSLYVVSFSKPSVFGFTDNQPRLGFITTRPLPFAGTQFPIYQGERCIKFTLSNETQIYPEKLTLIKFFHYHVLQHWIVGLAHQPPTDFPADWNSRPDLPLYMVPITQIGKKHNIDYVTINKLYEWMHKLAGYQKTKCQPPQLLYDEFIEQNFLKTKTIMATIYSTKFELLYVPSVLTVYPTDSFKIKAGQKDKNGNTKKAQTTDYVTYYREKYGIELQHPNLLMVPGKSLLSYVKWNCTCQSTFRESKETKKSSPKESSPICLQYPPELLSIYPISTAYVRLFNAFPVVLYRLEQYLSARDLCELIFATEKAELKFEETSNIDSLLTEERHFNQNSTAWNRDTESSAFENGYAEYRFIQLDQIDEDASSRRPVDGQFTSPPKEHLPSTATSQSESSNEEWPVVSQLDGHQAKLTGLLHSLALVNESNLFSQLVRAPGDLEFGHSSVLLFDGDIDSHLDITFDTFSEIVCPNPWAIVKALTSDSATDIWTYQQLETIGDSFLKMSTVLYLYFQYPQFDEGKLSQLKCNIISNVNLQRLALKKNLAEFLYTMSFKLGDTWCSTFLAPRAEGPIDDSFLCPQDIRLKQLADVVEALLGAFVVYGSAGAAVKFCEWLGLEHFSPQKYMNGRYMGRQREDERIRSLKRAKMDIDIEMVNDAYSSHSLDQVETKIGYCFTEKYWLVQAFTHSSYPNCIKSYERLEVIGDGILDFLLTKWMYHRNRKLSPSNMTSIRSSLHSNAFYASVVVKYNLHRHLRESNCALRSTVNAFVKRYKCQMLKQFAARMKVNEAVEEEEKEVDAPKALADVFEALVGAIFLDNGFSLDGVWRIVYRMIKVEVDYFIENIPRNPTSWLELKFYGRYKFSEIITEDPQRKKVELTIRLGGRIAKVIGNGCNAKQCRISAARRAMAQFGPRKRL